MQFTEQPSFRRGIYASIGTCVNDPIIGSHFLGSSSLTIGNQFRLPVDRHPAYLNRKHQNLIWNNTKVEPFTTTIFGELGTAEMGTVISAKGASESEESNEAMIVTDSSTCRNTYGFCMPTIPSTAVYNLFNRQLTSIQEIQHAYNKCSAAPHYHRVRQFRNAEACFPIAYDRRWQIESQAFRELRGSTRFYFVVRQPEIYDMDRNLVKPWELKDMLTAGVLLMGEGTFRIVNHSPSKKELQFVAEVLTVLDGSPSAVWEEEY
ncbi:hypothetical protein BJ165DRAFT_1407081 [Panaeolus papilionaceus]|nr:hypothetical protein BJ165DRAFT_1407081 [Panaeolus papilionaceus]